MEEYIDLIYQLSGRMERKQPENVRERGAAGGSDGIGFGCLEGANQCLNRLNQATDRTITNTAELRAKLGEFKQQVRGLAERPHPSPERYHGEFRNPEIRKEYEQYLDRTEQRQRDRDIER